MMPPEFSADPTLLSYGVDAGFAEGDGAYAEASMTYFATTAEQEATVSVRSGSTQIGTKTGRSSRHDFLPAVRTLRTIIGLPFAGACGHLADAKGGHKASHQFLVLGWKFFSWGDRQQPSSNWAAQPACEVPMPGEGGGGGDPYEGECELCQQWFYFYYDGHVTEWWECIPFSCVDTR